MIDLKKIGEHFTRKGLWEKAFNQFSRDEILELAQVFFSSPGPDVPADGWQSPYVQDGKFVIPFDCHPKYRWWTPSGQPALKTMREIGAPDDVIRRYLPVGYEPIYHCQKCCRIHFRTIP